MIVLIHTICHIIAELSLPAWQKEVKDITYEAIEAMKEAKKYSVPEHVVDFMKNMNPQQLVDFLCQTTGT